jgi:hypothetical protein
MARPQIQTFGNLIAERSRGPAHPREDSYLGYERGQVVVPPLRSGDL